jgi:hypothetical protein
MSSGINHAEGVGKMLASAPPSTSPQYDPAQEARRGYVPDGLGKRHPDHNSTAVH